MNLRRRITRNRALYAGIVMALTAVFLISAFGLVRAQDDDSDSDASQNPVYLPLINASKVQDGYSASEGDSCYKTFKGQVLNPSWPDRNGDKHHVIIFAVDVPQSANPEWKVTGPAHLFFLVPDGWGYLTPDPKADTKLYRDFHQEPDPPWEYAAAYSWFDGFDWVIGNPKPEDFTLCLLTPYTPTPTPTPTRPASTSTPIPPTPTHTPAPTTGANIELVSINSPSTVSPGQQFTPEVTVRLNNGQQLLESRGDMLRHYSGTNYSDFPHVGVVGTVNSGQYTFRFYDDHPFVAPSSPGNYESRWRVWAGGAWIGPEIVISFAVGSTPNDNNRAPGSPTLKSPHDWAEIRSEQAPELCWDAVSDPDGDPVEYYVEIYESAVLDNSGWISSTCWRPSNINGQYFTYKWHVKAHDTRGGQSGWSTDWHFSLLPPPHDPIRPTSVPQPTSALPVVDGNWWDSNYAYRRPLPIVANETLPAGVVIKVDTLDLDALAAQGKARSDYADIRVVRRLSDTSWQEVARRIYTGWDIEFQLVTTIAPGTDNSYYIYYGNPNAGSAPTYNQPPSGWWVDMYKDKWWSSWVGTWEHDQAIDFNDICGPPIDHRSRVGTTFDDSDKYRGRLYIPTTGTWTFHAYTNDGYALYIDGTQVGRFDGYDINRWAQIGSIHLKSGWHTFEAPDMWVNCGAFKLAMEGPGFGKQTIPRQYYQRQWGNVRSGFVPGDEEPYALPTATPTATTMPTATPMPTPTPAATSIPISSNAGDLVDSFESGLNGWFHDAGTDATGITRVEQNASDGTWSAKLDFAGGSRAYYQRGFAPGTDWSQYNLIQLHLVNSGHPVDIALSIGTGDGYVWHQSNTKPLLNG